MKFFALFAAVLALAAATPGISIWNLRELSLAVEDPNTDPAILPYLEAALNQMMEDAFSGQTPSPVIISVPVEETWTLEQITTYLHDPNVSPAIVPYLEKALNELMYAMHTGEPVTSITVNIPAMNVNVWTLDKLSQAVVNPDTDPELAIHLIHALNQLMTAIMSGEQINSVAVITPPGVPVVAPELVNPVPAVIDPPVSPPLPIFPVYPELTTPEPIQPVNPVTVASSPLVQIIININAEEQAPTPVITAPVVVSPWGPHNPAPGTVSPWGPHNPAPVVVSPWGPHNPAPFAH